MTVSKLKMKLIKMIQIYLKAETRENQIICQ